MRVFLSAFSGFTLAVPMNAVAAMMLYDKKTEKVIQYDQKNRNTYISLPRLFNMNDEEVHHGIILREWNSTANKVVLLTAEIKRDIEIPDKEFHPIPKSLEALRFSRIFNGIKFSDNPILLLNIEQLTQLLQEEQQTLNDKSYSTEQPLAEQPPLEEPPPAVVSEPSPPPPKLESQIEQPPLAEPPPSEEPPPAVVSEIEPLTELLTLEELPQEELLVENPPEEEPPEELLVEEPQEELLIEEPQEELLIEEPQEELLIEEPPEELLIEEPPEEPPPAVVSEIEPLTELLALSDLP